MQEKLIILLHAHDLARPSWAVIDNDSIIQQTAYQEAPENLARVAADKEVIVIVPAEDVALLSVNLPKMNYSRLQQAIPFALEEQLVSEVEHLHFAAGTYQANNQLPIAIVSHDKMKQWLQLLQSWSLKPDVIVSSVFALPDEENTWSMLINEMVVVRTSRFQGFACDKVNLIEFLDLALISTEQAPQLLHLYNLESHAFSPALNSLTKVQEDFISHDKVIIELAKHVVKSPHINLLQSTYATRKSKFIHLTKVWKITAYLAIAWVALLFLYPIVSYFILRQRSNQIEIEIAQIYQRNFPESRNIIAPKLRMEEKLNKLTNEGGEDQLFLLIGYIGKGMVATPQINLKRLDFQNRLVTLELTAASSQAFSAFTDFLVQQGLIVKQQNANLLGASINATLLIS